MEAPNAVMDYLLQEGRLIKWLLDFAERRERIAAFPNVGKRLDELRDSGADPVMVLTGLAMIYPGAGPSTKRQFKAARKRLLDLANRLEKVAKEVELTVSDPLIYSEVWKILCIEYGTDFTHAEKTAAGARYYCKWLTIFVNFFRGEAEAFREMGRAYDARRDNGIVPVLRYVKESTGKFHDDCMADLLQATHDAFGVDAKFSAEALRKLRQRKSPELVKKRKKPDHSYDWLKILSRKLDNK